MNWGLIGFGGIAPKFLASLEHVRGQKIYAIASKSNFDNIQLKYPQAKAYRSYEELLADPKVDVVYISTTHNFHLQNTLDAFAAGKHVLCEKPLGVNADECRQMIEAAKKSGLFLMEAIWTRFLPAYREAMKLVAKGEIGDPEMVSADFGFQGNASFDGRLFNPDLAGGSVLDVGIYPISFALDVFGRSPETVKSIIRRSKTGVDASTSMLLDFGGGKHAKLYSSVITETLQEGLIYGSRGIIRLSRFFRAQNFQVIQGGKGEKRRIPFEHTGYYHEIVEADLCIKSGLKESPIMPWGDSLRIAETMDRVLADPE